MLERATYAFLISLTFHDAAPLLSPQALDHQREMASQSTVFFTVLPPFKTILTFVGSANRPMFSRILPETTMTSASFPTSRVPRSSERCNRCAALAVLA